MTQDEKNEKLFEAIIEENIPAGAQSAIEQGADINALTPKGASALMVALSRNRRKSFSWLIKNGVNVDIQDNLGENVLMRLVRDNRVDYLKHMLDFSKPNFDLANTFGVTALHYASMEGREECAKLLIENGANVNVKTVQSATPVLTAAQQHNAPIVNALIDAGADIHAKDYLGQDILINLLSSPEHTMSKKEKENVLVILDRLMSEGIDLDYKAPSGNTPIFAAFMYGQFDAVGKMIEKGVDVNVSHNRMLIDNMTPLHMALEAGKGEVASLVIDSLKAKSPTLLKELLNTKNSEGNTPAAFGFFHATTRQLMLDNEADVNTVLHAPDGSMPVVLLVIQANDETSLDAMITKGVKLHFEEKEFQHLQPIRHAIAMGIPGMVSKIIKNSKIDLNKSIKINEKVAVTPLAFLVSNSKAQILETFLTRIKALEQILNQKMGDGSDAYALPEDTRNNLKAEIEKYKNIEKELGQNRALILDMLISSGADVNHKDENGRTAIFYCADIEGINVLLEKGADLFAKDNDLNTPLSWAIRNNRAEVIDHLLQYIIENDLAGHESVQNVLIDIVYNLDDGYVAQGSALNGINHAIQEGSALLDNQDEDGNTALIITCATEQPAVAQLLIAKGADVDLANNAGETALMHAVAHGDEKTVQLLIAKGASIHAATNEGKTVLEFAQEVQNKDIIALLEKKKDRNLSFK